MKLLKDRKKSTKTGKNFRGGGGIFSGWPEYIPLLKSLKRNHKKLLNSSQTCMNWLMVAQRGYIFPNKLAPNNRAGICTPTIVS